MTINIDNYKHNSRPSFGDIKLVSGAGDVLKKVLKPQEWQEFSAIIDKQSSNKAVDIILFGKDINSKKLLGRIAKKDGSFELKDCSQGIFQSTMKFINKMVDRAEALKEKMNGEPKVNIDEIIKKTTL